MSTVAVCSVIPLEILFVCVPDYASSTNNVGFSVYVFVLVCVPFGVTVGFPFFVTVGGHFW